MKAGVEYRNLPYVPNSFSMISMPSSSARLWRGAIAETVAIAVSLRTDHDRDLRTQDRLNDPVPDDVDLSRVRRLALASPCHKVSSMRAGRFSA